MKENIKVVGRGQHKVLALHGWFGSAESWGPLVDSLDQETFTYAFFDYRGYGRRKHVDGRFTLEEIAQDALTVANTLQWETFSLLGHSMGGAAVQHVLASSPARVQALVCVTPVPACGLNLDTATRQFFESAAGDPAVRRLIIDGGTSQRLSSYWLERMVRQSLSDSTPQAVAGYFPSWADTDITNRVKGANLPVHVIFGELDPHLTEVTQGKLWTDCYPNVSFEVMKGTGHYPYEETPVMLATSIESFLRKISMY